MTRLYIDGTAVSLPEDFKASVTEENPFVTKKGEYTYNIGLSLLDPINAELYKHKNRLNNNTEDISSRTAILIIDDEIKIAGTEIILQYTDSIVQIQIAAGNSALNYEFSENKKIWENDFGTITIPSAAAAHSLLNSCYPAVICNYPPYIVMEDSAETDNTNTYTSIVNMWKSMHSSDPEVYQNTDPEVYTSLYPCPYLLHYIVTFLELKGFSLRNNVLLSDDRVRKMLVINGKKTLTLSELLPDWTEKTFVDEVQKLFNVRIIIDTKRGVADIVRDAEEVTSSSIITLEKVIKSFEQNIETSNNATFNYKNVSYELPSKTYFNYQKFAENVSSYLEIEEYATFSALKSSISVSEATWGYDIINRRVYHTIDDDRYYMIDRLRYGSSNYFYFFRNINVFANNVIDDSASEETLKITPVRLHTAIWQEAYIYDVDIDFFYQYPWPSDMPTKYQAKNRNEIIEEGGTTWRPSYLEVFVFLGLKTFSYTSILSNLITVNLPVSCTDDRAEIFGIQIRSISESMWEAIRSSWFDKNYSLRLKGTGGVAAAYYTLKQYDELKPTTIYFVRQQNFDVKSDFVINNKKYLCEKIEYDVDKTGYASDIIKGTFYPLKN
jgi:hypothetical protein